MPSSESGPAPPAEAWEQVALLTKWPEQRIYEVIRPVVLFGRSPAVRARETGTPRSSLYRQVAAFDERGMARLFAPATPPAPPKHRRLPPEIRQAILAPDELHRVFHRTRSGQRLDRLGYLRFRNWHLYGERGLAGGEVAVWRYEQTLTVEFADEALAQYQVTDQPDRRHFTAIAEPRLFETPHRSPQAPLWEVDEGEWLKVLRLPDYAPHHARPSRAGQLPLFSLEDTV